MKQNNIYRFLLYILLLLAVLAGGYLTLSLGNQTKWATLLACIMFSLLGIVLKNKSQVYFVSILLFLYASSALLNNIHALFGPLICLVFFVFAHFARLNKYIKYSIILFFSITISFWILPKHEILRSKQTATYTYLSISTLPVVNTNEDTLLIRDVGNTNKLLLIETWHEHCGSCFRAMRDLHPKLTEIEKEFSFKHLYLYSSKSDLPIEEIIKVKYLPYQDLPIFKDIDSNIRKTTGVLGAPVFLLVNTETGTIEEYRGYIETSKNFFLKDIYDAAKAYPRIY